MAPLYAGYAFRLTSRTDHGVRRYDDEYHRAIDLGVASEAKYNEFVAKLKGAGSDKIIAEMQKQIDAWKITK
ncbi:DUF3502 domain-containing protein [Paenibacillus sp. Soil766]|uniref:DUF3502 domain-containing protein n=1 Tax=Paenibacillus sp. Soil766 TaxID=1736404 RepID=UPI0039E1A1BF